MSVLQRTPSIPDTSSSAMLPPTRSPGMGHPVSPSLGDAARNNYTTSTPSLQRHLHTLSPRLDFCPRFSPLLDTPRSVLPTTIPLPTSTPAGDSSGGMMGHGTPQAEQSPPFNSQENYVEITCEGTAVVPSIEAKVDKGFFYSPDNVWTCYRRNYFTVRVSFGLTPWIQNGRLYLNRGGKGPEQIMSMAVALAAAIDNSGGKAIELIQHTLKRDKGPQLPMKKELLSPKPHGKSHDHTGYKSLYSFPQNTAIAGPQLPLQNQSNALQRYSPASHTSSNYQHAFERIQFKSATANNGKRRAQQQYYHLIVELWANVQTPYDPEPQWVKVSARSSSPIVVRGRSPSHYSNEGPHNPNATRGGGGSSMFGPKALGRSSNSELTYVGGYNWPGLSRPKQRNVEQTEKERRRGKSRQKPTETVKKQEIIVNPQYQHPPRPLLSSDNLRLAPYDPPFIQQGNDSDMASKKSNKPVNPNGLKCKHSNCSYRGTFARKYDLERHMKEHTSIIPYHCPISFCNSTFSRLDKFVDHLVEIHNDDDQATCPHPSCAAAPMPFDLLRLHIRNHTEISENSVCSVLNEIEFVQPRGKLKSSKNLPSNSASPTVSSRTDSTLTIDRPPETQSHQAKEVYNTSKRMESVVVSPNPSPVAASLPSSSNDPIPRLEQNSCDLEISLPVQDTEGSKGEEELTRISQPHMEPVEGPSLSGQLSTNNAILTTNGENPVGEANVGPEKNALLLSKPSNNDMQKISIVMNSVPISQGSASQLENPGDRNAGSEKEKEPSVIEIDGGDDGSSECDNSVKSTLDIVVIVVKDLLLRELLDYALPDVTDTEECKINLNSALDTAMNAAKGLLLRELLDCALPEATDATEGFDSLSHGSHANNANTSASSSISSCNSNSQTSQGKKRMRSNGRDPGDDDGDESDDDDDHPRKKNKTGSPGQQPHRRLKCPFYQRQPEKYKKAACRGEGFADMAKLKDHIKRVHTQPLRCSRCWLEMKSEDAYSEHLQRKKICDMKAEPQDDRIRRQLLNRLDFKKAPYANARNIEEKWNMLFSVLFPKDLNIPSPYEQQGLSPRLEQALSEALEEKLTHELAPILEPIMSRIKELIPAIIESCRLKLTSTSPSSGIETASASSAISINTDSGNNKPEGLDMQAKLRSNPTHCRCLERNSDIGPTPDFLATSVKSNQQQHPVSPRSNVSVESTQDISSLESSTDFSVFYPHPSDELPKAHKNNLNDYIDVEHNTGIFNLLKIFPHAAKDNSVDPVNVDEIAFGSCDFVEGLSQTSNMNFPSSPLSICTLSEAGWGGGSQGREQPGDAQLDSTIPLEQDLPPWDIMIKDFDFPCSSNG